MKDQSPSEALFEILEEISAKEKSDRERADREKLSREKGKQLFNDVNRMANKYGVPQRILVGAGSRSPNVIDYRLEAASRLVTPTIDIKTKDGVVTMQIIEHEPLYIDDIHYRPAGFFIMANGDFLTQVTREGKVTNWLGENATDE